MIIRLLRRLLNADAQDKVSGLLDSNGGPVKFGTLEFSRIGTEWPFLSVALDDAGWISRLSENPISLIEGPALVSLYDSKDIILWSCEMDLEVGPKPFPYRR